MAIIYPDIDSVGWGDDVNANFRELNQNDTDIKAKIGTETMGTTATTLKGAIKEVKGIADNNTTQLNENAQEIENIKKIVSTTFSVSEGYTATLNVIKQDHLGRTIVNGIIKKTDGTTFATSDAIQIGALPSGFTPSTVLNQPIRSFRGNVNESSDSTMIAVSNNGALVISNIVTNTVEVQFHLVFDTK